jgi:hemerythrin
MALIAWSNQLSVNIAEIDNQHRCLIEKINKLHDEMKAGKENKIIGAILSDLIDYTVFHFYTEEQYFHKYQYPEFLRHKAEHDMLRTKAKKLSADFTSGKISIMVETLNFLRDWISNHILKSDKKYEEFFRAKGLK